MKPVDLNQHPVHLGLGATAIAEPLFNGEMQWYADYSKRHSSDGAEGRLVAMHTFSESWTSWEMHPLGAEVVLCTAGSITLIQEQFDGTLERVTLVAGEYAINPAGTWHTADVDGTASALFITAGADTRHRSR